MQFNWVKLSIYLFFSLLLQHVHAACIASWQINFLNSNSKILIVVYIPYHPLSCWPETSRRRVGELSAPPISLRLDSHFGRYLLPWRVWPPFRVSWCCRCCTPSFCWGCPGPRDPCCHWDSTLQETRSSGCPAGWRRMRSRDSNCQWLCRSLR